MKLFGLRGITHGGGRVLTVMSDAGASAALAAVEPGEDLAVQAGAGRLTQYHERRAGALARLVSRHRIEVLDKPAWDERKADLGDGIYR